MGSGLGLGREMGQRSGGDLRTLLQYARRELGERVSLTEGKITHMDKSSEEEVRANMLLILLDYLLLAEYTDRSVRLCIRTADNQRSRTPPPIPNPDPPPPQTQML